MKSYITFKWIQAIFIFSFSVLFCILSFRKPVPLSGYRFFFVVVPVFFAASLLFDLLFWKRRKEREEFLAAQAMTDDLTRLPNSPALRRQIAALSGSVLSDDTACVIITFENIHRLNRTYGHKAGDITLGEFGDILRVASADLCFTGRKGGRTFLSIFQGNASEHAALFLKRVERGVEIHNETRGLLPISYHAALSCNEHLHYVSIYDLIKIRK